MNKISATLCLLVILFAASFISCRKNGLNSAMAKKIQYRWERISTSSTTDYLDGRAMYWTTKPAPAGNYVQFDNDGYFYANYGSFNTKYDYKVDGDRILSLIAAPSRATTPQYTDTATIKQVDGHLLILTRRNYFLSGAYSYINEYIDSLKK